MICLASVASMTGGAALSAAIAATSFTLAWTHSIEKIRWEEDWRVDGGLLWAESARIGGTGAGMEPPAGAELREGVWHYRPDMPPQKQLRLTHSPHVTGYELCIGRKCAPLADQMPGLTPDAVIEITACP